MTSTPEKTAVNNADKVRNFLIAIVAIALTIAIFLGLKTQNPVTTLATLAEQSTPLEIATNNHKPTLMEFYADWCTSCQAMAGDLAKLKQKYADKLNFVMLNVDNTKWLPEILHYRVDGIPHFVFLNSQGNTIAENIGEIPREIMSANLQSLIADLPLPYTQTNGQFSEFKAPVSPTKTSSDDPRSHGG